LRLCGVAVVERINADASPSRWIQGVSLGIAAAAFVVALVVTRRRRD